MNSKYVRCIKIYVYIYFCNKTLNVKMKVQIKTNYHNIVSYSPNCNFKVLIVKNKNYIN